SPNAGVVMTAGAGSLNICLGGKAYYQGVLKEKPEFGGCLRPDNKHIKRSLLLVDKTVCLWVLALIIVEGLKQ
ncbi:MAG: cobalamin biosynthesis protein, partial [Pseudomonadota bacterium]